MCGYAFSDDVVIFPSHDFYVALNVGGGSTTWRYLVDTRDAINSLDGTTPVSVDEGGPSWGAVLGYNVNKYFALELQYMQFADSILTFDSSGQISYNLTSPTVLSHTSAYSLSGKFYVPVGGDKTHLRAFAAVGFGVVTRTDPLADYDPTTYVPPSESHTIYCTTPYMSAGASYNFTRHWVAESGFQYYTGFGSSQQYPVTSFVPFAWDAYGRLAYQF